MEHSAARQASKRKLLVLIRDWLSYLEGETATPDTWAKVPLWGKRTVAALDSLYMDDEAPDSEWMARQRTIIKRLAWYLDGADIGVNIDGMLTFIDLIDGVEGIDQKGLGV